jgi:hypothetical protein
MPRSHKCLGRIALATGVALTFAAQLAGAECGATGCDNARVLQLYTEANGNVHVQLSGTMSNLNCSLVSATFVTLQPTAARFSQIYASVLAAQLTDRLLSVRIATGSSGCTIEYINSVAS